MKFNFQFNKSPFHDAAVHERNAYSIQSSWKCFAKNRACRSQTPKIAKNHIHGKFNRITINLESLFAHYDFISIRKLNYFGLLFNVCVRCWSSPPHDYHDCLTNLCHSGSINLFSLHYDDATSSHDDDEKFIDWNKYSTPVCQSNCRRFLPFYLICFYLRASFSSE